MMRDPERLDGGEATAFERQLLRAGKGEIPSQDIRARIAEGLAFAGGVTPARLPAAKVSALGWKAGVAAAVIALGVVPAAWFAMRHREHAVESASQLAQAVPFSDAESTRTDLVLRSSGAALQTTKPSPVIADTRTTGPASIRDQIRYLDVARTAIVARQPRRALEALSEYDHRFPDGAFRPEAMVLHIEALHAGGETSSANALARQFLVENPNSSLRDRVTKILHP